MARASTIYKLQPVPLRKNKYKFPILNIKELVMLYDTMEFDIDETVLSKPTPTFMKSLIEQIMDKFLYVSPYSIRKKIENIEEDEQNENYNIKTSMTIIASQKIMYKFLCDCGVDDFSIRDVSKPESQRLRIILSALINYARFREERMTDCDELLNSNDDILNEYKQLLKVNNEFKEQIQYLNELINNEGYNVEEINNKNKQLENKLKELRNIQQNLATEHEQYKLDKMGLVKELENQSALYIETEKDLEQIRPYIKESPESVKELIQKMKDSEIREQENLRQLEIKSRNISISIDSFQLLIQDFNNLHKIVEELQIEATRHESYDSKFKNLKNQITETEEHVNEFKRKISLVERQLTHNEERIEKLKTFYKEKMQSFNEKLESQTSEFVELKSKKTFEEVDLNEKEAQISNWERQINEIEKNFDYECKDANFELEKLNSQISLYINEMTRKINDTMEKS